MGMAARGTMTSTTIAHSKMAEVWKPVPSLSGVMASSEGRLLLPPRYAPVNNGGYRSYLPKPIKGTVTSAARGAAHKYRNVFNKHFGNIKVHQAVCEAFHGPKPFPHSVVIHLDENALNNRPENLKWGTQKENLNMPKFKEYARSRTGARSPRSKWAAARKDAA
jgi:hypothetical protein